MAYYAQYGNYGAGDNYGRAGNYPYQAGGIFGSIGKFIGGVVKTGIGLLPGPAGAIARAVTNLPRKSIAIGPSAGPAAIPQLGVGPALPFGPPITEPGTAVVPAGGALASGMCMITRDGRMIQGRPNKSTYVTRGGGTSRWPQQLIVHERGTECVRPRRMNVANPRALRRAIRRGRGFIKLSRKAASAFGFTVVSRSARKGKGKR